MNINNLTIKAQEAIAESQGMAARSGNPAIDTGHLMLGIMAVDTDVTPFILRKFNVAIEPFKAEVQAIVDSYPTGDPSGNVMLATDLSKVMQKAYQYLKTFGDEYISIEHMLLALSQNGDKVGKLMVQYGMKEKDLIEVIKQLRGSNRVVDQNAETTFNALNKYAKNLNEMARQGKLDPVIGRDEEIRRVIHILSRRTKNNPILIGEPGVGKTAIAEGIAFRILNGDVPSGLAEKTVYSLDMGALIAGAKFKGEFEERLKAVVKEVADSEGEIILFIDEIHTLVGAGGGEGAMDAANILKPALARGELRSIGATTLNEYQKYFEKDKALERRFQKVMIDEPTVEDAISILRGLKERYESYHKVKIKDAAIIAAVNLSKRYVTDRFLPDKAIDLIDEAASKTRIELDSLPEELDEMERKITQLEIEKEALKREANEKTLEKVNNELAEWNDKKLAFKARWQEEKSVMDEIQQTQRSIEQFKLEADQAERSGNYGLVAELRYGKIKEAERKIQDLGIKLDEVQKDGSMLKEEVDAEDIAEIVSRWTGIPAQRMTEGDMQKLLKLEEQLGERVKGQADAITAVADAIRRNRSGLGDPKRPIGSFIFIGTTGVGKTELARAISEYLFDDERLMTRIDMSEYQEKHSVSRLIGAPPGYVGYDEGGQLTEAVRRKPYSVVLLDEIEKAHPDVFNILLQVLDDGHLTDNKGRQVNFKNCIIIMTSNLGSDLIREAYAAASEQDWFAVQETTRLEVMELLKRSMRPEFLNRIDEVVMFHPLDRKNMEEIVKLQLNALKANLAEKDIFINYDDQLIRNFSQLGYEPEYGARPLKRLIQKELLNTLSKKILKGEMYPGRHYVLTVGTTGDVEVVAEDNA